MYEQASLEPSETEGVTDLRIHGVGGTPPEKLLRDPHVMRVSGDDQAGFYRPARDAPDRHPHREAMSWGSLTAGAGVRALWVLLLPFALVNLGGFMQPPATPANDDAPDRWARRSNDPFVKTLVRAFAVGMTVVFTLIVAVIALDLVALQCGGTASCRSDTAAMRLFGLSVEWGRLDVDLASRPGQRLAIGALVPTLVVAALAFVGRRTYRDLEGFDPEGGAGAHPNEPDLMHPDMWRGEHSVGRLRSLHRAAGFGTVALALLLSLDAVRGGHGGPDRIRWWLSVAAGALVLSATVTAAVRAIARAEPVRLLDFVARALSLAALVILAASIALGLTYGEGSSGEAITGGATGLTPEPIEPLLVLSKQVNKALLVLLALLFLVSVWRRWTLRRTWSSEGAPPVPEPPDDDADPRFIHRTRTAFGGFGPLLACVLAWMLLGSAGAGFTIRTADLLGCPQAGTGEACVLANQQRWEAFADDVQRAAGLDLPADVPGGAIDVPVPRVTERLDAVRSTDVPIRYWPSHRGTALAFAITLAGAVVILGAIALWAIATRKPRAAEVRRRQVIDDEADALRVAEVAKAYLMSPLVRRATTILAIVTVLGAALASYLSVLRVDDPPGPRGALGAVAWLVTLVPVLAAGAIYAGLRTSSGRGIGVVWDVLTFWPRVVHPFAPPCYAERAVPQLVARMSELTRGADGHGDVGRLVLSSHSQGSVVAAAALLQSADDVRDKTWWVTYGSPLTILYARLFPAYWGGGLLPWLRATGPKRWTHLWARTDPLGEPMGVFAGPAPDALAGDEVADAPTGDTWIEDPAEWAPPPGQPAQRALGHSTYHFHPRMDALVRAASDHLRAELR